MPENPELADAQPARTEAEPAQREGTKGGLEAGISFFVGAAAVSAVAATEIAAGVKVPWPSFAVLAGFFFLLAFAIWALRDRMLR